MAKTVPVNEEGKEVSGVEGDRNKELAIGVDILQDSYDVLGYIIGEEEEEDEQSVGTNDCEEEGKGMAVTFSGWRERGVNPLTEMDEVCQRPSLIFEYDPDQSMEDIDWVPTLDSAKVKRERKPEFANLEELKASLPSAETRISRRLFDSAVLLGLGEMPVQKYTLANSRIQVDVLDYGATVTAVRIREGDCWTDVALGFDNVAEYISSRSEGIGGTIGRVAGRVEEGKFKLINEIGLHDVQLSKNCDGHHLNGGFRPLHKRMWSDSICGDRLVLSVLCADGEDGYPGELRVWAAFSLLGDSSFNVEYTASSDTVTPVSIANGIVINLAGHNAGPESLYDHSIFINSELCCDPTLESSDKIGLVYGTPYDLTDVRHLGCVMNKEGSDGLDLTYALYRPECERKGPLDTSPKAEMMVAAVARHVGSGRTLVVSTDQWGLRLHTCNNINGLRGKDGAEYGRHAGLCLQTGSMPNSINIDDFPNVFITPLEPYHHSIRYYFTTVQHNMFVGKRMFPNNQPWLQDRIILACDDLPQLDSPETSEEIDTVYTNIYATLEKLAEHRCGDNFDDDNSLSLHSSFTSFGSEDGGPLPVGETALLQGESQEVVQQEETLPAEVSNPETECETNPELFVKSPYPLPPYLTGEWPLAKQQPDKPTPHKKVCSSERKKPSSPQKPEVRPFHVKIEKIKKSEGKEGKLEPKEYSKIELGLVNRVPAQKCTEKNQPILQTPDRLDMANLSDSALRGVKGTERTFQWLEPGPQLPWYCGDGFATYQSVLPEEERRKRMGTFFKLLNFPREYTDFEGSPEDLLQAVQLKAECLKAHYNSIRRSYCSSRTPCTRGSKISMI